MVDKHEEITLPIVLSCNYQSDITYPGQKQFDCGNPVIDKFVRASQRKVCVIATVRLKHLLTDKVVN